MEENSQVIRIAPSKGWVALQLKELWAYRELLYFMIWRDVKVRYKQTALGVAWAIIQPVFTMIVFSLFFGRLGKIPSDGIPYPIFSYAALVPWTFFTQGLSQASNSLVGSAKSDQKGLFPPTFPPDFGSDLRPRRFCACLYRAARDDALLRHPPHGQCDLASVVASAHTYNFARCLSLAFRLECPIP